MLKGYINVRYKSVASQIQKRFFKKNLFDKKMGHLFKDNIRLWSFNLDVPCFNMNEII